MTAVVCINSLLQQQAEEKRSGPKRRTSITAGFGVTMTGAGTGTDATDRSRQIEDQKAIVGYGLACMVSAIRTLRALPDQERAWLAQRSTSGLPEPIRSLADGDTLGDDDPTEEPRTAPYRPTPREVGRCLDVLAWLTDHENTAPDGERDVQVITAYAFDVPWTVLARRYRKNERTMRRWFQGAVANIALRNMVEVLAYMEADGRA